MAAEKLLIVDANVLIDYVGSEPRVLYLAARHLGTTHVARPLLREVRGLSEAKCKTLGLTVVDPSVSQLLEAGAKRGALSFEDRLCLILARDECWVCVTNDGRLRNECSTLQVGVLWGLELMALLVNGQHLEAKEAVKIVLAIHRSNPQHINQRVIDRFRRRIDR